MTLHAFLAALAATLGVAFLYQVGNLLWYSLVERPRWMRRVDRYLDHSPLVGQRCGCADCVEFRREMGWLP